MAEARRPRGGGADRLNFEGSTRISAPARIERYRQWHALAQPYFAWQCRQFRPYLGSRVADVGCGVGNLAGELLDRELYVGVDLDATLLEELRHHYPAAPNLETLVGDITDPACRESLRERRVETVLSANVIEHIEDDRRALGHMVDVLPRGGTLCLLVPAMPWLYGTLDRLDGHFRRYTGPMVRERLAELPVEVVRLYYFNLVGALGWLWKGRVLKEATHADENFRLMSRLVPLVSRLERLCPPPFGMSLIAVARRR